MGENNELANLLKERRSQQMVRDQVFSSTDLKHSPH